MSSVGDLIDREQAEIELRQRQKYYNFCFCGRRAEARCQHCDKGLCNNCLAICKNCQRVYCPGHVDSHHLCRSCGGNVSMCFIATAAYGTPFAKEIEILRWWRDSSLKVTRAGEIFVLAYYKISPPIARFISKKPVLKWLVRVLLSPLIKLLNWKKNRRA